MEMPVPSKYSRPFFSLSPLIKLLCSLVLGFVLGCTVGRSIFPLSSREVDTNTDLSRTNILETVALTSQAGHVRKNRRPFIFNNSANMPEPFILSIVIDFNTVTGLAHFKSLFEPMAQWVHNNEPGTTSYSFSCSDKDPLQGLVFEKYVNRRAYAEVHKSSAEFLAFKRSIMAMNEEDVEPQLGWKMTGKSFGQPVGFV